MCQMCTGKPLEPEEEILKDVIHAVMNTLAVFGVFDEDDAVRETLACLIYRNMQKVVVASTLDLALNDAVEDLLASLRKQEGEA